MCQLGDKCPKLRKRFLSDNPLIVWGTCVHNLCGNTFCNCLWTKGHINLLFSSIVGLLIAHFGYSFSILKLPLYFEIKCVCSRLSTARIYNMCTLYHAILWHVDLDFSCVIFLVGPVTYCNQPVVWYLHDFTDVFASIMSLWVTCYMIGFYQNQFLFALCAHMSP